jgi:hypothetical protein
MSGKKNRSGRKRTLAPNVLLPVRVPDVTYAALVEEMHYMNENARAMERSEFSLSDVVRFALDQWLLSKKMKRIK